MTCRAFGVQVLGLGAVCPVDYDGRAEGIVLPVDHLALEIVFHQTLAEFGPAVEGVKHATGGTGGIAGCIPLCFHEGTEFGCGEFSSEGRGALRHR